MTRLRTVVLTLLIAAVSLVSAHAAPRRTPKLVVILVVDQMRADYIEKFGAGWTGGFRLLMNEGAWFRQAAYPYMTMVTCAGHATIATGSFPATHGIVSNSWWDRAAGKVVNCVADEKQAAVGYGSTPAKGTATSTHTIRVSTLSDELRAQLSSAPRIVTLSMKDYTATALAGRQATAATWFSASARSFMTSSAYAQAPVPFIAEYLKANPVEKMAGQPWAKLLPDSAYVYADDGSSEDAPKGWTGTFPHLLEGTPGVPHENFYAQWEESPFSDAYLGQLAEHAIVSLKLGQGSGTDYLAVSFSTLDLVGHDFGPRSQEVQDVLARLDRTLASLIGRLDTVVGRSNYVLALTADHGIPPIPEQLPELNVAGGRLNSAELIAKVEKVLAPALGPGPHVARQVYNDFYFRPGVWDTLRSKPEVLESVLATIRAEPGVSRVFRSDEVSQPAHPSDRIKRAASLSYFPGRSGDLIIIPRPYFLIGTSTAGTSHGAPYWYDQRVPLFLLGQGIQKGQFSAEASPADVAPTLAYLVGVTLPSPDGRVLNEALSPMPAPGAAPIPRRKR